MENYKNALEKAVKLTEIPGIAGVAETEYKNNKAILVLTSMEGDDINNQIPSDIDGFKTIIQFVGEIDAY